MHFCAIAAKVAIENIKRNRDNALAKIQELQDEQEQHDLVLKNRRKKYTAKTEWVKAWLERPRYTTFEQLINQLQQDYMADYMNFLRIDPELFEEILTGITPLIERKVGKPGGESHCHWHSG